VVLRLPDPSVAVFRATVLSMALVFAAGPNASLYCEASCDSQIAAVSGCHHEARSSTSIATANSCRDTGQTSAILLKDDPRRRASFDGADSVVAAAEFRLAMAANSVRPIGDCGRAPSDLKRPLTTPLRI
jgi:hypothetical protein